MSEQKKITDEQIAKLRRLIQAELASKNVRYSDETVLGLALTMITQQRGFPADFWSDEQIATSVVRELVGDWFSPRRSAITMPPIPPPPPSYTPNLGHGLRLYLNPGEASEAEVRAVLRALNDLHVANGGLGLEFRIDGLFVFARDEVHA